MSRKLIVVGNGLGMAIAPKQFGLKPVMQRVWREGLEEDERKLLAKHFRDIDEDNGPSEERHLMVAQVAVIMPEMVEETPSSHAKSLKRWFTAPEELDEIKEALNNYCYAIAKRLFECVRSNDMFFPPNIQWDVCQAYTSLSRLMGDSSGAPHITTLNYDGFLYTGQLFEHYTDGFLKNGGNLPVWQNKFAQRKPRYLHLHGSPLFWEAEGHIE
ncbi:hypothetical protein [Celeribacter halophilus]|uniref:hypothetical protein n=1 Tax=Celeribacter halophilus TaxID=576117 RepID=UPI002FD0FAB0